MRDLVDFSTDGVQIRWFADVYSARLQRGKGISLIWYTLAVAE